MSFHALKKSDIQGASTLGLLIGGAELPAALALGGAFWLWKLGVPGQHQNFRERLKF